MFWVLHFKKDVYIGTGSEESNEQAGLHHILMPTLELYQPSQICTN